MSRKATAAARRTRCSTASVPDQDGGRRERRLGPAARGPATSPTSTPSSAASSSRRRLTPARRVFMRSRPQAAQTTGRVSSQRGQRRHLLARGAAPPPHRSARSGPVRRSAGRPASGRRRCGCRRRPAGRARAPPARRGRNGPGGRTPRRTCRCAGRHRDDRPARGRAIPPAPAGASGASVRSPGAGRQRHRAARATPARQGTPSRAARSMSDVHRAVGGGALLPVGRVVRVEHDGGRQPRARGPRRRPGSRRRRASPHGPAPSVPAVGHPRRSSRAVSRSAHPTDGTSTSTLPPRARTAGSPTTDSTRSIGSVSGGSRTTVTPGLRQLEVASGRRAAAAGDRAAERRRRRAGRARWSPGDAVRRKNEAGPAQRQAAHSASSTTAGRRPPPQPRLEREDIDARRASRRPRRPPSPARCARGTAPAHGCRCARRRASPAAPRSRTSWPPRPPRCAPAPPRARRRRAVACVMTITATGRRLPSGERSGAQSPKAARRSSTRGVASHVNSFSERPKWP